MPPDIVKARKAAIQLLLEQNPAVMPVRVQKLQFPVWIRFDSMEGFCRVTNTTVEQLACAGSYLRDGCTLIIHRGGRMLYLVLYNSAPSPQRLNFTLAHEVGHILLGHTRDGQQEEQEANAFAAELLMPRVLAQVAVEALPLTQDPARELAQIFSTSLAVARLRLQSLDQTCFSLEQRLLRRYGPVLSGMR